MQTLTIHLKTITPLFLGGADHQKGLAELRAPSIKGVLRYWYRAIDPDYNRSKDPKDKNSPTWEEYLFGSADHGTGVFRLVVAGPREGRQEWKPNDYNVLNELHPNCPKGLSKEGQRSWTLNGVRYLSYSLKMGENDRRAIPVGQTITVTMRFPKKPDDPRARRAIAAAWWLLGHVGGLGSRSRRGFGTVALQGWPTGDEAWEEFEKLPIAHNAKTAEEWMEKCESGLTKIRLWYPKPSIADHLILGHGSRFYLIRDGHEKGPKKDPVTGKPVIFEGWEYALNRAGRLMQDYRQRHGVGTGGDYDQVRNHLLVEHPRAPGATGSEARLTTPPARVAFGLPLTFRYGSLSYPLIGRDGTPVIGRNGKPRRVTPEVTFQGHDHDRNASPIHIRIIQIGDKCYPFFARFDAPLLAKGEKVAIQRKSAPIPIAIGSQKLLDDFCKTVLEPVAMKA